MINFPHGEPLMMPWCSSFNPTQARIEMMMNKHGLGIVVPDIIMPKFELEPFTEDELRKLAHRAYWYKRANILKFRSIIRKAKQNEARG